MEKVSKEQRTYNEISKKKKENESLLSYFHFKLLQNYSKWSKIQKKKKF